MKALFSKARLFLNVCLLTIVCLFLNSCGIIKRDRKILKHGIEANEGLFSHYVYEAENPKSKTLIVFLSGDGGWLEFNDNLAQSFANAGYHTIGINARNYFWEKKTPQQTTFFLIQIVKKYRIKWKCRNLVLIGYSFGADVVPFVYNLLPLRIQNRVKTIHLLSPYKTTDFFVKITDLINLTGDNKTYNVETELRKISIPITCYYGENETYKPFLNMKLSNLTHIKLKGSHKYVDANDTIVNSVLLALKNY